jgi:hypothetical protein
MRRPLRSLGLAVALLLVVLQSLAAKDVVASPRDIRFGAVEAYDAPNAALQAGVAWERVRFHWAKIQAGGEGSWDDGEFTDDVLAAELAAGREVVGLLIGLPGWANENGIPRGLHLPHNDPRNLWATFVRTAVARYAGRIDHWILWNEPDVWDSNHPGHTWGGSVEDFFQLTRAGYVTAKESNPNAVIHLAAVTHWWDAVYGRPLYFQSFLEVLVADQNAAGNNYYFDVATLHLYFQPHFVFDLTSYYYGMMHTYGIWKPIWIVETNAPPSTDPAWPVADPRFHVSLAEQAAYMPQALAMGMAAGAQRIGIYKLIDTPEDVVANPEPFGLVRADGSHRPAFSTFGVATSMLAGATRVTRDRWDDVGSVTVEQEGGTTTVLFSRIPGPRVVQVPAGYATGTLMDMWGNRRTISARDGSFRVELPAAPCSQSIGDYCMIGGPTFYLVQGAQSGGAQPAPPPATAASPAALPTTPVAEATATPTPSPTASPTATATPSPTPEPTLAPSPSSTYTPTPSPKPPTTLPPQDSAPTRIAVSPPAPAPSSTLTPTPTAAAPALPPLARNGTALAAGVIVLAAGLLGLGLRLKRG